MSAEVIVSDHVAIAAEIPTVLLVERVPQAGAVQNRVGARISNQVATGSLGNDRDVFIGWIAILGEAAEQAVFAIGAIEVQREYELADRIFAGNAASSFLGSNQGGEKQ